MRRDKLTINNRRYRSDGTVPIWLSSPFDMLRVRHGEPVPQSGAFGRTMTWKKFSIRTIPVGQHIGFSNVNLNKLSDIHIYICPE
jgi:hypothetical protein